MTYIECKVWHFQGDDDKDLKNHNEIIKAASKEVITIVIARALNQVRSTCDPTRPDLKNPGQVDQFSGQHQ
ncbi:11611_t:CDS:2, partial [Funneliformis geosporum]